MIKLLALFLIVLLTNASCSSTNTYEVSVDNNSIDSVKIEKLTGQTISNNNIIEEDLIQNSKIEVSSDSIQAFALLDSVWRIKEVIERNEYVKKETGGKRHLATIIHATPTEVEDNYYWIKVTEDNGVSLYTHFNFFVYQYPYEIMVYDVILDDILSLKEWRINNEK